MTKESKVARFGSKLNPPLATRLQSIRLTTFAETLDAGRLIEQEFKQTQPYPHKDVKPITKETQPTGVAHQKINNREFQNHFNQSKENRKRAAEANNQYPRLSPHIYEMARQHNLCLACLDPNHQVKNCPTMGNQPNHNVRNEYYNQNENQPNRNGRNG